MTVSGVRAARRALVICQAGAALEDDSLGDVGSVAERVRGDIRRRPNVGRSADVSLAKAVERCEVCVKGAIWRQKEIRSTVWAAMTSNAPVGADP